MIKPNFDVILFRDQNHLTEMKKIWNLPINIRLQYKGIETNNIPTECELIGFNEARTTLVISINGQRHCISPDYFSEMQDGKSNLPNESDLLSTGTPPPIEPKQIDDPDYLYKQRHSGKKTVIMSKQLLRDISTNGNGHGYNRRQLQIMGVPFPLNKNWKRLVIGKRFTPQQIKQLKELSGKISVKTEHIYEDKNKSFHKTLFFRDLTKSQWKEFQRLCKKRRVQPEVVIEEIIKNKLKIYQHSGEF